jgi:spermidine synthase
MSDDRKDRMTEDLAGESTGGAHDESWFFEELGPGVRIGFEAARIVASRKSAHQELMLIDNEHFGRVLMLDGATQLTTADEFIYHEMLVHVPLLAHGRVKDVLIIGGGDGALAEEVLKHPGVRNVTQVEIDASVVEFARQHLSEVNRGVFADSRFRLRIGDGAAFVGSTAERFDVVLVDSTDPQGAATVLFTPDFYRAVRRCLQPGGVMVVQAGVPFLEPLVFASTMNNLASVFELTRCYLITVPSYFGGHLALGWASDSLDPDVPLSLLSQHQAVAQLRARYYTPEVHHAAFALPPYISEMYRRPPEAPVGPVPSTASVSTLPVGTTEG